MYTRADFKDSCIATIITTCLFAVMGGFIGYLANDIFLFVCRAIGVGIVGSIIVSIMVYVIIQMECE